MPAVTTISALGSISAAHLTDTAVLPVVGTDGVTAHLSVAQLRQQVGAFAANVVAAPYLADPTGATDSYAAMAAAVTACAAGGGGTVTCPAGTFLSSGTIALPSNVRLIGAGMNVTTIRRTTDAPLFTISGANYQHVQDLTLDLAGTTCATAGLAILDNGYYAQCDRVFFTQIGTNRSAVTIGADAFPFGTFDTCFFEHLGASTTVASVALSTSADAAPRYRHFVNCQALGGVPLLSLGQSEMTWVIGCEMADLLFGASSRKATLLGNRIATSGGTLTVQGINHALAGNVVAGPVVFDGTTQACSYAGGVDSGVTDNGVGTGTAQNKIAVVGAAPRFTLLGAGGSRVQSLVGDLSATASRVGVVTDDTGYAIQFGKWVSGVYTPLLSLLDGTRGVALGAESGPQLLNGTGSPNAAVAAPLGSLYLNKAGGAGTSLYVKESGGSGNTGWVGK